MKAKFKKLEENNKNKNIREIHSSKKLGEHVFETYTMLQKTILHAQVYLYSLTLKYKKDIDGYVFIFRTQTEMSK
jgi:hypothetical protein